MAIYHRSSLTFRQIREKSFWQKLWNYFPNLLKSTTIVLCYISEKWLHIFFYQICYFSKGRRMIMDSQINSLFRKLLKNIPYIIILIITRLYHYSNSMKCLKGQKSYQNLVVFSKYSSELSQTCVHSQCKGFVSQTFRE